MPAFLVELPVDHPGFTLHEGANKMVVFADDAASALEACEAHFPGVESWVLSASANEIVAGLTLNGYQFTVNISGAAGQATEASFTALGGTGNIAVQSDPAPIVSDGAATYMDDDIETLVGGTLTRAATVRVTDHTVGVVNTVEVVDPGEYTILPGPTSVVTTGNGDGNMELDIISSGDDAYEVFLGQMVTLLNSHADIVGAGVDMSEALLGTRLFTFTTGSGGDDLGDAFVEVRFGPAENKGDISGLKGTITSEGATTAVTSMALPTVAGLILPNTPVPVKG
jgi:hypothetical protein